MIHDTRLTKTPLYRLSESKKDSSCGPSARAGCDTPTLDVLNNPWPKRRASRDKLETRLDDTSLESPHSFMILPSSCLRVRLFFASSELFAVSASTDCSSSSRSFIRRSLLSRAERLLAMTLRIFRTLLDFPWSWSVSSPVSESPPLSLFPSFGSLPMPLPLPPSSELLESPCLEETDDVMIVFDSQSAFILLSFILVS